MIIEKCTKILFIRTKVPFLLSLNYIKQNRLKDHLCLKPRFLMEMLRTYEYAVVLARISHGGGPHVFIFFCGCFRLKVMNPNVKGNSGA